MNATTTTAHGKAPAWFMVRLPFGFAQDNELVELPNHESWGFLLTFSISQGRLQVFGSYSFFLSTRSSCIPV
ncbi:MAG: hypothetical protein AMJ73_07430 [candidate division Zixibacteria bacterium SM1_73]|nr:MAG: hypothetical protein AMJ73_07430 [candidate division Zixibacteria bacterium SM1_73]